MESFKKSDENQEKAKQSSIFYLLLELGIEFAVMIGLPLYLLILAGKWADNRFHTHFFVLIAIFLALGFSSYLIYKRINQVQKILKK